MSCLRFHSLALACIALHCFALPYLAFAWLALPCLALAWIGLSCIAVPCIALLCFALLCLALPCLALHCFAFSSVERRVWRSDARPWAHFFLEKIRYVWQRAPTESTHARAINNVLAEQWESMTSSAGCLSALAHIKQSIPRGEF